MQAAATANWTVRLLAVTSLLCTLDGNAQTRTAKPPLHGQHWMAIAGKPLAATAGAMIFQKGGNAVDAACGMIAASATIWDTLSWGGETQALIFNPRMGKVVGINALGVAPTGATPEFFRERGLRYPPAEGPLAAVTPGTPGGIMVMLAEFGTMSLEEVLAPALVLAEGYPMERETAGVIQREMPKLVQWPDSRRLFFKDEGKGVVGPEPGEIFRQPDLAATLRKLIEAERRALAAGKDRKAAIYAAYERFYEGDIAGEIVRAVQELGGLFTRDDLARWRVRIEEPVSTRYRGIDVYKLTTWVQGPAMLQTLNLLETFNLKGMGYNSPRYIHTVYQAMSLAFADRDFYYGDPYFPPEEPVGGLLSKEYARERAKLIDPRRNDQAIGPGDPYPFQDEKNPFTEYLRNWRSTGTAIDPAATATSSRPAERLSTHSQDELDRQFRLGTTSIEAADAEGWVVSITPSGGWLPAVIAGRTGIGLSQRMQSFVLDPAENPYNVVEPGKRPRATLTPTLALKDGKPFLSFAVQGGDSQEQNLLQFFLNVVEFGMAVQEAAEAANFTSYQMRASFGEHHSQPGRLTLHSSTPAPVQTDLQRMGYKIELQSRTSGPINAIYFDHAHGTLWGGSSNHGEDYGIAW